MKNSIVALIGITCIGLTGCATENVDYITKQDPTTIKLSFRNGKTRFAITNHNNELTIRAHGPRGGKGTFTKDIVGFIVKDAKVSDLNQDGHPELFIFLEGPGPRYIGQVLAYTTKDGKHYQSIYVPHTSKKYEWCQGYRGQDEYQLLNDRLIIEFPNYLPNDRIGKPSGGKCRATLKLVEKDNSFMMQVDRLDKTQF